MNSTEARNKFNSTLLINTVTKNDNRIMQLVPECQFLVKKSRHWNILIMKGIIFNRILFV